MNMSILVNEIHLVTYLDESTARVSVLLLASTGIIISIIATVILRVYRNEKVFRASSRTFLGL